MVDGKNKKIGLGSTSLLKYNCPHEGTLGVFSTNTRIIKIR
jgi:hypothetical protein